MSTSPRRQAPGQETGATLASLLQRAIPATVKGAVSAILALAGVVGLFLGVILLLFLPELRTTSYLVLATGGVMLLVGLLVSFATVWGSVAGRRGRYSTNTTIMIISAAFLGGLVYYLGTQGPLDARWDITATRQFTLAPQTVDILEQMAEPVQVTAFFVPGNAQQAPTRVTVGNLLSEFQHLSDGQLEYRFVDPDIEPTLASRYGVNRYPAVVFESQTSRLLHRLTLPLLQELDFTSALLIVTGVERKTVYMLTGHGERPLQDVAELSHDGFGFAASGMSTDNYRVQPLSLLQNLLLPNDAAAIVVAGPKQDLSREEFQLLRDYLKGGGSMAFLLEPDPPESFRDLLADWGIAVEDGTIIDWASHVSPEPQTPLITFSEDPYYNTLPVGVITGSLDQVYFRGAAPLHPSLPLDEMPATISAFPVAQTTPASCITQDLNIKTCPQQDFGRLVAAMAVLADAPLGEGPLPDLPRRARIVVFGDADFATNFDFSNGNNGDLFLNSVNWLTEDISLASVRPKSAAFRRLVVTGREMQMIRALGWFVLPTVMALLATVAWWRRR